MKLEKLRMLELELISQLSADGVICTIHYQIDDVWFELSSQKKSNDLFISSLNKSKLESIAHHTANSLTAWFFLKDVNATASIKFPKSPQITTRKKYRERIQRIQESSSNAYRVSHHSLTHLLAKDAFRQILSTEIKKLDESFSTTKEAQESEQPKTLAALALDIDYFKQVNDTWGHLYGDQVLKSFGKRLERTAEKILATQVGSPQIYLGHPSGEEFLILIIANATREQLSKWANEFRTAISDEILPTDNEWQWLCSCDNLSALTPPAMQDRGITTSIGIALHTNTTQLDSAEDPSSNLLDRADTALYRAKAAGRNQVIFYDEILSSCGRILEQDTGTKVIAIDIGSNVGVTVGQEFKVFHPTFTGKQKFSVNDGRTTRTLGTYPRVESSRIVVFNTQPEISFAYIDSNEETNTSIEPGSHLEAIPAGSIGHLLPSSSKYFPAAQDPLGFGGLQTLQDFTKASATAKTDFFTIIIRFKREPEYLRKYGTAALNNALARLYRVAQTTFPAARCVEVLDRSSICIAGPIKAYKEDMVTEFTNSLAEELPELGVLCGVCNSEDLKEIKKEKKIEVDAKHSIELARFSASEFGRGPDERVRHFSHSTAYVVLQALREARTFETAYADFLRLISFGVDTASIQNLGGLIATSLGSRRKAFEHYESALSKDPSIAIYKTNFGSIAYILEDIEPALKVLNTLSDKQVTEIQSSHPYGYLSYAGLLAKAKITKSDLFDASRFSQIATVAMNLSVADSSGIRETIKYALNS